jgi:xanthine dehydrogenase accessory factor
MAVDPLEIAHSLSKAGRPFVLATVVRCERPTSAKPGAKAIITSDGKLTGWVGGSCAEPVVIKESLKALRDGQPRFLSLLGEGGRGPGRTEGMVEYQMTCHSGGTLEIYLDPVLPKPGLVVIGRAPVVESLTALGKALNFTVTVVDPDATPEKFPHADCLLTDGRFDTLEVTQDSYVVAATHGNFDEEALEWALGSPAPYVTLVASRKRAGSIVRRLLDRGISPDQLGRLKAPAGLDIGAVTPEEIALSILAEIVQVRRSRKSGQELLDESLQSEPGAVAAEARDPICGMMVDISTARYRSEYRGRPVYFCCLGCKRAFDQAPEKYASALES